MYMHPTSNGFRDIATSLYTYKTADKGRTRLAVSTYSSSEHVGTFYVVRGISKFPP
jgi:hypothetical protein